MATEIGRISNRGSGASATAVEHMDTERPTVPSRKVVRPAATMLPAAATKRAKEKAMGMAKAKRAKGSIAPRSIGLKKRAGTAKKA